MFIEYSFMKVLLFALSFMLAASSSPAGTVSPKLLIGTWHSDYGPTYYFRADGTWERRAADMTDGGKWKLRSDQELELLYLGEYNKIYRREIVAIDRIVHETLYVRTGEAREVWLKQPSS
jgi:hypothetical protein